MHNIFSMKAISVPIPTDWLLCCMVDLHALHFGFWFRLFCALMLCLSSGFLFHLDLSYSCRPSPFAHIFAL